jgi:hypothetical protein
VNALLAAIVSKYQEATAITASGPFFEMSADEATYPRGVISVTSGGHEPFYGTDYDEIVNLRFTVMDDNLADVITIQNNLHTRFDKTKLTLSSGRNYHSLRRNQLARFAGVDANGVKVYQAISDYQFKVRKSY